MLATVYRRICQDEEAGKRPNTLIMAGSMLRLLLKELNPKGDDDLPDSIKPHHRLSRLYGLKVYSTADALRLGLPVPKDGEALVLHAEGEA